MTKPQVLWWMIYLAVASMVGGQTHAEADSTGLAVEYRLVGQWGEAGSAPGQLDGVQGLAVSPDGEVFVADAGNCRIQVFDTRGRFLRSWGSCGQDGVLRRPTDVAVSPRGEILVVDFMLDQIVVFDREGGLRHRWGKAGAALGELSAPVGVAVDSNGHIYVSEFYNHRVQKLAATGQPLGIVVEGGHEPGRLHYPAKLAVSQGMLYVADAHNYRIQKLTLDGDLVAAWGSSGTWKGQFQDPVDVVVDANGDLHVADSGNFRIQWLDGAGNYLTEWSLPRKDGPQLQSPQGLALGPEGFLYASDPGNGRINKLEMIKRRDP